MTVKWILMILFHYDILVQTSPSIAGVTYMDDFDFEQRYRDVNECDPFYWHPLHMPEVCADMFEKLIRSRIASRKPVRVMRERHLHRKSARADNDIYTVDPKHTRYSYFEEERDYPFPIYEIGSVEHESKTYGNPIPPAPYEKMLQLLKKDIKKDPSVPKIGVLPNLGPVAIYNQEISKKSKALITELATAYAKFGQKSYADYVGYENLPDPQLYIWDSEKNKTKPHHHKKKNKNKKNSRLTRSKTKHGGVVTIVETLNPRRRRSALYLFGT